MWIYPTVLLATLLFLLYKYYTRRFDYWKNRNVFYLKPLPFLGNMFDLFMKSTGPVGQGFLKLCEAAGNRDYFGIFIFDRPTLVVTNPKLTKAILQKDSSNFIDRTIASSKHDSVFSNALFVLRNPTWKEVRTKVSPVFTSGKLKMMFPLILKESKALTDYINTIANVPDSESKEICAKYATNVITRCIFAVDANSFKDENAVFRNLGRKMFDFRITTALRQLGSLFQPNIFDFLHISFIDPNVLTSLKGIFSDVLHTRMRSKNLEGNDFVDMLIEASRTSASSGFSEQGMLGQAVQFFGAGFETTSATLSFALYELCINPEIQEKLRNEIMESFEKNRDITYDSINDLKYLDMCISETLRKYPPLPFLDRTCKENYKLDDSDFVIEKGTSIYMPIYAFHYNPKYFPDPEKYDPERFTDRSELNNDGLWYMPFGEGPRICIGQRFGLMTVKLGIASILSKYRLEKSKSTPVPMKLTKSFVIQSTVGVPLKFIPI